MAGKQPAAGGVINATDMSTGTASTLFTLSDGQSQLPYSSLQLHCTPPKRKSGISKES